MKWQKIAGRVLTFGIAAMFLIFAATKVVPTWWPGVLTTGGAIAGLFISGWKPEEPTDVAAPNWQQLLGRGVTTAVSGILLVFAATGVTPDWWPGVLTLVTGMINQVLGSWKPPQVA